MVKQLRTLLQGYVCCQPTCLKLKLEPPFAWSECKVIEKKMNFEKKMSRRMNI